MVFAWPEPPNAKSAGKSAGARCGVQETFASGGTEAPTNRPGKKSLPANCNRHRGSICMSEARAFAFRERALQAHKKAMRAGIPEETRRAWLIVERDWTRMAEREELNDAMSWLDGAHAPPQKTVGPELGDWLGYAR